MPVTPLNPAKFTLTDEQILTKKQAYAISAEAINYHNFINSQPNNANLQNLANEVSNLKNSDGEQNLRLDAFQTVVGAD